MNDSTNNSGNTRPKRKWLFPLGVAAIAISSIVVVSCFHDDDPATTVATNDTFLPDEPAPLNVTGTGLYCDETKINTGSTDAANFVVEAPDSITQINISRDPMHPNSASWLNHNGQNNLKHMSIAVKAQDTQGNILQDDGGLEYNVRPLIVSYSEQVFGEYEFGDGSADIGDPDNFDDVFTSLSMDNGQTWKKVNVSGTAFSDTGTPRTSSVVKWAGEPIAWPGHSMKPTMQIQGDKILVAWNDKYCPSGNPFDLEDPATEDYYKVNGAQGVIDYGGITAPNGKPLYEVPFSCVWTARGVLVDVDTDGIDGNEYAVQWRAAQQLTSGTRDSNKIWIASFYDASNDKGGFALTWQEDTEGLWSGLGAGPGEGYSGATTSHGSDIWYTYIDMAEFDDVCAEDDLECDVANAVDDPAVIAAFTTKPKPAVNLTYPVRITNNEICTTAEKGETKLYCLDETSGNCASTTSVTSNNESNTDITRCVQDDLDYMTPDATIDAAAAVLDGDTGASRPALKILRTNADEYVAILAYEETKGLSEQGTTTEDADIALEGKAVYLETFFWDQPVEVSAGRIVNLRVPDVDITKDADNNNVVGAETGDMIYENARRVVQIHQVDACEMGDGDYTFGMMYKQGFETKGGPSDMYIRMNTGFTYDTFEKDANGNDVATNVSAHDIGDNGEFIWDDTWLAAQSYTNPDDNTFSPRAFLRGAEIYTGFEYSPLWRATSTGTVPNNFWIHRYVDGVWHGPQQISIVTGDKTSTLDPRFVPTPKGLAGTDIASDQANPDVLFMSYGTFKMDTGEELGLYYTRSTDKGATWEYWDSAGAYTAVDVGADRIPRTDDDTADRVAKLSDRHDNDPDLNVLEMEVQSLSSPDGTMLYNAYLTETHTYTGDPWSGLESRFGRVDYVDPATIPAP